MSKNPTQMLKFDQYCGFSENDTVAVFPRLPCMTTG